MIHQDILAVPDVVAIHQSVPDRDVADDKTVHVVGPDSVRVEIDVLER